LAIGARHFQAITSIIQAAEEFKAMIAASGADLRGDGRELLEAKVIERLAGNEYPTKNQVRAAVTAVMAAGK
jgi:hypothetical protein